MGGPRPAALVVAASLTVLALLLIADHGPWSGPHLITITPEHGLNLGDVPVLGIWLVGVVALRRATRRQPHDRSRFSTHPR
jgi:hypothetical protein